MHFWHISIIILFFILCLFIFFFKNKYTVFIDQYLS